jgi:hypothetical protein
MLDRLLARHAVQKREQLKGLVMTDLRNNKSQREHSRSAPRDIPIRNVRVVFVEFSLWMAPTRLARSRAHPVTV